LTAGIAASAGILKIVYTLSSGAAFRHNRVSELAPVFGI
jgi:hypothetical protein